MTSLGNLRSPQTCFLYVACFPPFSSYVTTSLPLGSLNLSIYPPLSAPDLFPCQSLSSLELLVPCPLLGAIKGFRGFPKQLLEGEKEKGYLELDGMFWLAVWPLETSRQLPDISLVTHKELVHRVREGLKAALCTVGKQITLTRPICQKHNLHKNIKLRKDN